MKTSSIRYGIVPLATVLAMFALATPALAATLTRELSVGMSGTDVTELQTFLAKDPTIYPQGLITGYFGPLTRAAVINFQSRNGIATVGRVGPITLAAINAQMNGLGVDIVAPTISNVSLSTATSSAHIMWVTNEPAAGIVYYSTTPMTVSDSNTDVTYSGSVAMTDTAQRSAQNIVIPGLQPNTSYYYAIYARDASGNVQTTWPSTFKTL